mmetsp:Transcript_1335/g.3401  ORF Transcript_1335/g.3401 Transcript_1335/m.3401 type:complete len:248 (+) Transcript_1335:1956-2699(+)
MAGASSESSRCIIFFVTSCNSSECFTTSEIAADRLASGSCVLQAICTLPEILSPSRATASRSFSRTSIAVEKASRSSGFPGFEVVSFSRIHGKKSGASILCRPFKLKPTTYSLASLRISTVSMFVSEASLRSRPASRCKLFVCHLHPWISNCFSNVGAGSVLAKNLRISTSYQTTSVAADVSTACVTVSVSAVSPSFTKKATRLPPRKLILAFAALFRGGCTRGRLFAAQIVVVHTEWLGNARTVHA